MGVSVRLSRNVRAYLPFWLAIPVMLAAAVVWVVVVLAAGLCWLVFLVQCPHGKYTYRWPLTLECRWRWDDHFKQMMAGHEEQCPKA